MTTPIAKHLGAQEAMRSLRDLLPSATVAVSVGPDEDGALPWMVWVSWQVGEQRFSASTLAATMPEALAALREKVHDMLDAATGREERGGSG